MLTAGTRMDGGVVPILVGVALFCVAFILPVLFVRATRVLLRRRGPCGGDGLVRGWVVLGRRRNLVLFVLGGQVLVVDWGNVLHAVQRRQIRGRLGRKRVLGLRVWYVRGVYRVDGLRLVPVGVLLRVHGPLRGEWQLCCRQVLQRRCLGVLLVRGRQVHVRDGAGDVRVVRHRAVFSGGCDVVLDVRGWDVRERDGLERVRLVSFGDVLRHDRSDGSVRVLRGWRVLFGGRHGLHIMCSRQDRQLGGRVGVRCVPRRDLLKCRSVGVQCVCQGHLRVIAGVERVRSVLAWPVWRVGKTHGVLRLSGGNVRGVVWVNRVRRLHGGVVLQG